ncbi:LPXTG cell wall anchor domain-containing protein [Glycomyces xiaoerkulensis]|uniref:LPXTG cell wall anchor domain-containing protein n=1 Tax=Glycomyces xiaoerkulensis TaxID=2038139 RepID=UPI000C256238|nr:LPXTG cell wall anchor domain-containing protein [Glycomyces xiaoerkulensis]
MSAKSFLRHIWLPLAAVGALAVPAAAQAQETISINPGNVPTTAEGFEDISCEQVPVGIGDDQDGWVFVLPGGEGAFVSVTAQFEDLNGEPQSASTGSDGGVVDGEGTSKAYIITDAGWTLTGATAEVEDTDRDQFNLTHTCPGAPSDDETTPPDDETTPPGDETTPPGDDGTTPGEDATDGADDGLPTTGSSLLPPALLAVALLAAGAGALYLVRRRAAA